MKIKRLVPDAQLPTKAHDGDLGYDLYASENVILGRGCVDSVPTGIAIQFPAGLGGVVKDRSSMARQGIFTCGGVIDSGYRGEIRVLMYTIGSGEVINKGQKIAQMILTPVVDVYVEEVAELSDSDRGAGGFGSTGV